LRSIDYVEEIVVPGRGGEFMPRIVGECRHDYLGIIP
jgi:hypothetical protein